MAEDSLLSSAVRWSAELDRCLRSTDPAVQVQGILSIAPGIRQWGDTPLPGTRDSDAHNAQTAHRGPSHRSSDSGNPAAHALLDEELALANSLALRLADTFRTASAAPAVRLAVLKLLLLHLQGQTAPLSVSLPPIPADLSLYGAALQSTLHGASPEEASGGVPCGFFSKERLLSWEEFVRRIADVASEPEALAKSLALRALGCVAPLAASDTGTQRLVLESLNCGEAVVVEAALFAASFLVEVSPQFAVAVLHSLRNALLVHQRQQRKGSPLMCTGGLDRCLLVAWKCHVVASLWLSHGKEHDAALVRANAREVLQLYKATLPWSLLAASLPVADETT